MNLSDMLDDVSAASFSGAIFSAVKHSLSRTTSENSGTFQHIVFTKESRRQLLITGYLKKVHNNHSTLTVDTYTEKGAVESDQEIRTNKNLEETFRFVGVAMPLSNQPKFEITLETVSPWERKCANFTVVYNTEFICVDADDCHLLGYSRFELLGTNGYDYIHTDDLQQVTENHTQLIKYGTNSVLAHRFQAKSGQWVWVNCTATVENRALPFGRVRCTYSVMSLENVRKLRNNKTVIKAKSDGVSSFSSEANTSCNSRGSCAATEAVYYSPSVAAPSSVVRNPSDSCYSTNADCCQPKQVDHLVPSTRRSSMAKIIIESLPPKRTRQDSRGPSTEPCNSCNHLNVSPSTPFEYTSPEQRSSSILFSPTIVKSTTSSKLCYENTIAFTPSHFLPDSRISTIQGDSVTESSISNASDRIVHSGSVMTSPPLSISPIYRQVWEELQSRSEVLRQQVLQKEIELRELRLQKFIASLHRDK